LAQCRWIYAVSLTDDYVTSETIVSSCPHHPGIGGRLAIFSFIRQNGCFDESHPKCAVLDRGERGSVLLTRQGQIPNYNRLGGAAFWAREFFVNTVGRDEDAIRAYIRDQEREDQRLEQVNLWR
jgi:hypothetical protein